MDIVGYGFERPDALALLEVAHERHGRRQLKLPGRQWPFVPNLTKVYLLQPKVNIDKLSLSAGHLRMASGDCYMLVCGSNNPPTDGNLIYRRDDNNQKITQTAYNATDLNVYASTDDLENTGATKHGDICVAIQDINGILFIVAVSSIDRRNAEKIWGTLNADHSVSDLCTVSEHEDGDDPGATVTVYDPTGSFFSGKSGARFRATWSVEKRHYTYDWIDECH